MNLKVIGTGSKGNCYILENETEALIIECGVRFSEIKAGLNFNLNKVVGCLVTHEHGDHASYVWAVMEAGIPVMATEGTHQALNTIKHHRAIPISYDSMMAFGDFVILPFKVVHDAAEPCGFLINHRETGNVLFMTDSIYSPFTFRNLNNIIIEANYHDAIAKRKLSDMEFLRNRVIKNHMSLNTCKDFLLANDLSAVNNIVLIHLSDSNSDENLFRNTISEATGKTVTVADNGLVMELNKTPF